MDREREEGSMSERCEMKNESRAVKNEGLSSGTYPLPTAPCGVCGSCDATGAATLSAAPPPSPEGKWQRNPQSYRVSRK